MEGTEEEGSSNGENRQEGAEIIAHVYDDDVDILDNAERIDGDDGEQQSDEELEQSPAAVVTSSLRTRLRIVCLGHQQFTYRHVIVFLLTFFSYALFHASRKTFSNVKSSLVERWLPPVNLSCHNDCYVATEGLYVSGFLGDRFDPRLVLAFGMWLSAIGIFMFGVVTEWLHFYSIPYYVVVWALTGFVQSSGWPTEVCVMGNWFGRSSRGAVLGLWSACASVGNIIGAVLAAQVLHYGYEYTFLLNALLLFCGGVVIFFGLVSAPRDVGLPDADEDTVEQCRHSEFPQTVSAHRHEPVSFVRALFLPGVLLYSLAYACLKFVNYSFFFWLPYYLHNKYRWEEKDADELSTWYDWGGIIAGFLAGILTDHLSSRTPVIALMLLLSTGALYAYAVSPADKLINAVLMTVMGFFIGGPSNLISAAVSADLGREEGRLDSDNAEALSTVTGIVDGTGSVGAAVGQLLVPLVENWFHGWMPVFYMFIIMIIATFFWLLPLLWNDIRQWCRRRADSN